MKSYPANKPCPCDSGKTYGKCCKTIKEIQYKIDDSGSVFKEIKLHPEAMKIIKKNEQEFKTLFGRAPESDEPVFINQLLISEEDYMEGVSEIFKELGLPEEHLYAHQKTGLIVTEMNRHLISKVDILKYEEAIKEYRDIKAGKKKIKRPGIIKSLDVLTEKLHFNQILLGLIIRKQNDKVQINRFDDQISKKEYLLFCLTKNLKTLRAALTLMHSNFGEDALNLIRSIFENYLHIAMSIRNDDFINDIKIKIGLLTGTHAFKKKGSDKIVEIATNRELKLKFTKNYQLASLHPEYGEYDLEIYRYLYDFLSNFTHPNLATISCYVNEEGFNYLKRNFSHESILYISYLNVMILNELKHFKGIDRVSVKDIEKFTNVVVPHLIKIFKQVEKDYPEYPSYLRRRIEKL
ncbi:SEC-C domain-containing protein [Chitinophaga deserti]|uniref:SEC-C domain-containing protein n=1 Tax=Chitinophaga deserti TaxID=2164099 RepID=UPI000D6C2B5D|nr:SEC-C domain-containing protein [Chitinophaga deserti]